MVDVGCSSEYAGQVLVSPTSGIECLERDIVVWRWAAGWHVFGVIILGFAALLTATATAAAATCSAASATTTPAAAIAAAEHLQAFADNFELGVLLAVFFPALELEAAFDQDRRAFAE